jgi:hypothetical protein
MLIDFSAEDNAGFPMESGVVSFGKEAKYEREI